MTEDYLVVQNNDVLSEKWNTYGRILIFKNLHKLIFLVNKIPNVFDTTLSRAKFCAKTMKLNFWA